MIYRIVNKGKKFAYQVKNREDFLTLRNSKKNLDNLAKARKGDEKAKAQLVQFAYNIGVLQSSALAGCKSIGSYFFHDVDCYDAAQSEAMAQQILAKKDEIGLMMLEKSASGGSHLVCKREPGTTILENQVRVSSILQIEMDTNVHDLQRVSYSSSGDEKDLLYLDDELFEEPMTAEECEAEYARLKERERRSEEDVPAGAKKARKHYKPWEEDFNFQERRCRDKGQGPVTFCDRYQSPVTTQSPVMPFPDNYHGIPFTTIIKKYWEMNNGGFEPNIGDRDTLTYQLACDLRHICARNAEWLDLVIPCYDGFPIEEKRQKIANALKSSYEGMPGRLKDVLDALEGRKTKSPEEQSDQITLPEQMPEMPTEKKLPKLIRLLTRNTPNQYKAAVAHAVFPPLGTHLKEVSFEYTDYVPHEATLMNCLMAHTGAGKGCIDEPIRHIMADIKRRDEENTRREAEWKKDCQKKGANKDKQVRPEGLVIQEIDPDMTKPALVTRMDEAEGHFVYVKLNEIDLFEQLKGQTGKQHFQLMCLAFDPGAEFGQTRVGTQSVTARPKCRFNWNACTTIQKGRKFFSRVLTDGPISRINFCTIPEMEIGAEQPIYGKYDSAFDEELKPYIDNLVAAHGMIDCPQAFKLAKKLQEECAEFARLSQDETYWNLSHRAIVIAWLKACVLYVANGNQWEKNIEDFVRWSLQYDLWCKMQFFGEDIEAANSGNERIGTRGPRNLLELLPNEFTLDDAKRIRQKNGKSEGKTIKMIRNWINRNYVIQNSEFSFVKSEKYKKR
ncbi:MAG: hypothetical protein E7102_06215 [Prevotella ruminicola]|uniref:VirE N-terminal domain-containing protein n=1 Tax=Xylanibacter ruminicola TaxID=839 RepID=A0A928GII1_XYLRU|nr:hypothetical protein [Xylanibacter ruminicola]